MHLSSHGAFLLLGCLIGTAVAKPAAKPKNAILLSDVQSLTLRDGKMTSHRRVPAVPQLTCVSSPAGICRLHKIDAMRCTNQGAAYDAEDIQWSCTASLPPELKLGATDVVCEGYSSSDDPYVLRGSCAVEYRLMLTDYGEQKFPELAGGGGSGNVPLGAIGKYLFYLVFISVVVWIIWSMIQAANGNNGQQQPGGGGRRPGFGGGGGGPGFGGGGGGGGGGGWDDPPPPYPGQPKPWFSSSSASGEGWRPGFWTGAATGGAAGYAAGRAQERRNSNNRGWGGGGFGGGYGGDGRWGGSNYASSSSSPPPPRSSSSSSSRTSTARHESTGFGSTKRR